ncbi:hypothetical protein sos41_31220 [Alphaproteobacteria bacterium SO-S41]|nr:hypothetical protein sos41_31220 [Alphaproteobacteria bacterium SO-S41]
MASHSADIPYTIEPGAWERSAAARWVNGLIGRPWVDGAEGPYEFGCWGLVRHGLKELAGLDLPTAPIHELVATLARRTIRKDWRAGDRLSHLAICLMGRSNLPHHVGLGLMLDGGIVAHAIEGNGVITSSLLELRVMGFQRLRWLVYQPPSGGAMAAEAAA